jgi:hypothetical protein
MVHSPNASSKISLNCALVAAAATVTLGGCTMTTERKETPLDLPEVSSPLVGDVIAQYQDAHDTMDVVIVRCEWSGPSSKPDAICFVPEGYVVVGGGAEVKGPNDEALGQPGALLVSSFPVFPNYFVAVSKDHIEPYPHYVRAYAIGLRIKDTSDNFLSAAQLRSQMYVIQATTVSTTGNTAALAFLHNSPEYQSTDLLVGGGAHVSFPANAAGQLLYGSHPFGPTNHPTGWFGYAKDHGIASDGTVGAWAIGMRACPAPSNRCFTTQHTSVGASAASTYQDGYSYALIGGYDQFSVMTSIGGFSGWSGHGRLLAQMIPHADDFYGAWGGGEIRSKDHTLFDDSSDLNASSVRVFCSDNCQ